MTHHSRHLKEILQEVEQRKAEGARTLVVFDLDSTLLDVSPRIQRILSDYAHSPEFLRRFPESCEILKTIQIDRNAWGIRDSLMRAGLDGHHIEFHESIRDFWKSRFFANDYLQYDIPYDGAVQYAQKIFSAGAEIVYLTGRNVQKMSEGSFASLRHWKFPIDKPGTKLVLKPLKEMDDPQFKSDFFSHIGKENFKKIWFFENEPLNIEVVRRQHPEIELVFFNSTHSGKRSPPQDLPTILHYLLDG